MIGDSKPSFIAELRRRNVWRVAIAYIIASWLFLQIMETVTSMAGAPEWVDRMLLAVVLIGLPVALILSWAFEITPDGVKREKDVVRDESITRETGSRLDKITIGVFIIAVVWVIADRTVLSTQPSPSPEPIVSEGVVSEEIIATEVVAKSIAVLPFMNMSEDANAGHFSDGLADTVLHKLAQIRTLHVVARNSSFQFRGQNIDVREVGEKLNVATVLEGSVQASGTKIRVTAQLIDVSNGYHLWSGNFDRELNDVFGIQDEIAEEVVKALKVSLGEEDTARLARRDTDNVDAFREYSLGLREADKFSFEALPRALEHLDKAIAIDPGYALAYAAKANTYRLLNWVGSYTSEQYQEAAKPVVDKALQLDPELPLALALLAEIEHEEKKVDSALSLIDRAVSLAPNDATVVGIHASIMSEELQPQAALESRRKAIELDPLSIPAHQPTVNLLSRLQRYDEARELARHMQLINSEAPAGYWAAAYIETRNGNWAEGIRLLVAAHHADPSDPLTMTDLADTLLLIGLTDIAAAWYAKSMSIAPEHASSIVSELWPSVFNNDIDLDAIRLARKQLIFDVDESNYARLIALATIAHSAHQSGYYDEYLAWVRKFYPELFDPDIERIDDWRYMKAFIGYTMILAGEEEQGRHVIEIASTRIGKVRAAFQDPQSFNDFALAAISGDRDTASDVLKYLSTDYRPNNIYSSRIRRDDPWLAEYQMDPTYQTMLANWERHAVEQRELLLEIYGGTYPMPEKL